jgi:hypothetical protein
MTEETMTRQAACSCGQLHLTIEGEPSRIAMCHCLECQRRTGAVLSNQARFRLDQIAFAGKSTAWTRKAESGNALTYHFCPTCGSTVFWENEGFPGHVTVAIGNFADPTFPALSRSSATAPISTNGNAEQANRLRYLSPEHVKSRENRSAKISPRNHQIR